jgi:exopolyphosphatase/guanosine-5'-triphosphate,3'-diphosphate pyrophosphatase
MTAPVASIDIGTNSTRLLVAEAGPDGALVTRERLMRITRLGQGVDRARGLAPEAIDRTVAVLREYRTVLDRFGVDPAQVRMAATSASRDAANRDQFFDAAEPGVRPELLSGDEGPAVLGATADLDPTLGPFLVFDLGAGPPSSCTAYRPRRRHRGRPSADFGCVRLSASSPPTRPPPRTEAPPSATSRPGSATSLAIPNLGEAATVVGLAGTVTTVAAVELGLETYDRDAVHHFVLTKEAAEDVFRTLATESLADRLHNPGLEPARADVIVGGCCALVAIYRRLGLDEVLVSEADILDGLARSLL